MMQAIGVMVRDVVTVHPGNISALPVGDAQEWTDFGCRNITVNGGVVHLRSLVPGAKRRALTALVEGARSVR
jgi:hypothetical protein